MKISFEFHWLCSPPTTEPHMGICLSGNPFAKGYQGYVISILMLMINSYIEFLGFISKVIIHPGTSGTSLSYSHHPLIQILAKIWTRADMNSWLIRSDLSDHLSSLVRARVECCKLRNLFGWHIKDCSATRILSSSITGCHPPPTGSFIRGRRGTNISAEVQSAYSTAPTDRVGQNYENMIYSTTHRHVHS